MSVLVPRDDDDDYDDTMTRSTTRRTVRSLIFNYGLMRTFGNSRGQSLIKGFRMWRGEKVYLMPQKSAFHGRLP